MNYRMTKPRLQEDIKQVYIYNGYWLLDYGNGKVTKIKNDGVYERFEDAIKEIDYERNINEIYNDIEKLQKEVERVQATQRALEEQIQDKYILIKRIQEKN